MSSGQINYLTPEGKQKLEQELVYLRTEKRQQVASELKAAIAEGDLSENAGYQVSKRDQALLEGRIREIEAILTNVRLLETDVRREVVSLGSRVTVSEAGGEPEEYMVVSSAEADPFAGRISNVSPLGRALMGHKIDDSVSAKTPGGTITFKIIGIA